MFLVLAQVTFDAVYESSCGGEEWSTTPWGKCAPPAYKSEWEFHRDDLPSRDVDLYNEMYAPCIRNANRIDMPEFGE